MNGGKFLQALSKTYKQILFEQEIPNGAPATTQPPPPVGGPVPPPVPAGAPQTDTTSNVEKAQPIKGPISQETQALLIGLLAKSIFLDIEDEEKYQLKNMQSNLSDETAPQVELEVVKKIKSDNYEIFDLDESLFELTPDEANTFINSLITSNIIGKEELKSGGGEVYLLNLIITALLRNFDISEKGKVIDILEEINKKRVKKESRHWEKIIDSQLQKYVKI